MNEIFQADSLSYMHSLPDNFIDLTLTDPPYGLGMAAHGKIGGGGKAFVKSTWDDHRLSKEYMDEILRVSKNAIIFGGNYYADMLPASRCWIVWFKKEGMPSNSFADAELAWTSFDQNTRVCSVRWNGWVKDLSEHEEMTAHPTQKPLELMRWILDKYSLRGDLILDPFCGSGTTCVAAKQLGRNYIGVEINPQYVEISRSRCAEAQVEENIFDKMIRGLVDDLLKAELLFQDGQEVHHDIHITL